MRFLLRRSHHETFSGFIERIENQDQFILNRFFSGKLLNVVNQKHVRLHILFTKLLRCAAAAENIRQRRLHFCCGGKKHRQRRLVLLNRVFDHIEQMRLACRSFAE